MVVMAQPPDLDAKVAFLSRPDSYAGTAPVETIETHMSWLFLVGGFAYKMKKPYVHDRIDYGTLAARRRNMARELRLNRRLAADVYLRVLPLTCGADGTLALGGAGTPVEWLLQMRRLPMALTLEQAIRSRAASPVDARRIVARLVPFFAAAARYRSTAHAYRRRLRATIVAAAGDLAAQPRLAGQGIVALATALEAFVATGAPLLDARVAAGRVVEGHGDLRPEHVYLTEPPTIVDCIEFDRDLRTRDPADELGFLAMECDRLGLPGFRAWLFDAWRELAGDDPPAALVDFHMAANALVRARISIWHLRDTDTGPPAPWIARAADYLAHARRHARHMQAAMPPPG